MMHCVLETNVPFTPLRCRVFPVETWRSDGVKRATNDAAATLPRGCGIAGALSLSSARLIGLHCVPMDVRGLDARFVSPCFSFTFLPNKGYRR